MGEQSEPKMATHASYQWGSSLWTWEDVLTNFGQDPFHIFNNDLDNEVDTEIIKFAGDTKLGESAGR